MHTQTCATHVNIYGCVHTNINIHMYAHIVYACTHINTVKHTSIYACMHKYKYILAQANNHM